MSVLSVDALFERRATSDKRFWLAFWCLAIFHVWLIQQIAWTPKPVNVVNTKIRVSLNTTVAATSLPEKREFAEAFETSPPAPENPQVAEPATETSPQAAPSIDMEKIQSLTRQVVGTMAEERVADGGLHVSRSNVWSGAIDSRPERKEAVNQSGMVTTRIVDRWGNVRCLQQRGDPFDSSTWAYHRVPAALCDFLR